MGIDLLTLFLWAFVLLVIGVGLIAFGLTFGAGALIIWASGAFRARQQRRIRIERRA